MCPTEISRHQEMKIETQSSRRQSIEVTQKCGQDFTICDGG